MQLKAGAGGLLENAGECWTPRQGFGRNFRKSKIGIERKSALMPACSRCGFQIDAEPTVHSDRRMLRVQATLPAHADDPLGARVALGEEFWVCARCQLPGEAIIEVVKTGAAEQARLAEAPLPRPLFWPREVLSYESFRADL